MFRCSIGRWKQRKKKTSFHLERPGYCSSVLSRRICRFSSAGNGSVTVVLLCFKLEIAIKKFLFLKTKILLFLAHIFVRFFSILQSLINKILLFNTTTGKKVKQIQRWTKTYNFNLKFKTRKLKKPKAKKKTKTRKE